MSYVLWLAIFLLCAYGAYRAIRGGFRRPQSDRLNGYGIFACILLLMLALAYASRYVF